MNKALLKEFQSPSSEYRGKPFWAWNGKLEPQELRRQIRVMKRMGLGGFFMHSRVGLDTPYLQKEWFDSIDACLDEAKKQKMEAWLYDEDRWPSGAAGGLVTKDKRFRMRNLTITNHVAPKTFAWTSDTVAAFCVTLSGTTVRDVLRLSRNERLKTLGPGRSILAFVRCIDEDNDWYNGQAYLDTMNPEAVKAYIKSTHEAYRKKYGPQFGTAIPGIFTDEPNHGPMLHHMLHSWDWEPEKLLSMAWTDTLPAVFKKRYGYDVLERLPELVFDLEGQPASQARYHYHDCTTFLFVDSFCRQIGEWCEKNHILFTGHVLEEDTLSNQTNMVGSAMRSYEYMQAPGMDLLTERWRVHDTAKQVSSMARQFGRKWRLTETYGCTGWDFSFAGHKALGDWQAALGINLRCQHLSWYTMLGQAKRDYPAGIFYQSPWWELYSKVEDYYGRIHAVMTKGEEVRDLLVIHPIESTWLECKQGWRKNETVVAMDRALVALRDTLHDAHIDFDYGEEEVLSRHGRVAKGKAKPELAINKARYSTVFVPPLRTIRKTTLTLLRKFKEAGGLVVFSGEAPALVDALPSDEAQTFAARCGKVPVSGPALAASVEAARRVSITDADGKEAVSVLYLLREDKEAYYLFLCNTSLAPEQKSLNAMQDVRVCDRREAFPRVTVKGFAGCKGQPLELDPDTGAVYVADASADRDGWKIETSLPVLGSRLFRVPKLAEKTVCKNRVRFQTVRKEPLAQPVWPVRLSECNNLVLDRASYKIGKGETGGPEEVLRLDRKIRDALKIKHRGGQMVQPWAQVKPKNPKRIPVELFYEFQANVLPGGDLFLALEKPEKFRIRVNDSPLNTDADSGWWVDLSLRKIPVDPAFIRPGKNRITLSMDYEETFSGLEIMYLLGNFGTCVSGTEVAISAPVSSLNLGDWVGQGLSFYSGNVSYCAAISQKPGTGERLFVTVPEYRGVAVRVIVNGKPAGVMAWEPNEVDITDFLADGENDVCIEVVGHRRNSHGPHHHIEKWPMWTGPGEYQAGKEKWFDGYNLVPCGLMQAPEIHVRRVTG
ncbi:MAG: glycosyl hydrolase [Fibrobacterota bacterium]